MKRTSIGTTSKRPFMILAAAWFLLIGGCAGIKAAKMIPKFETQPEKQIDSVKNR